MDAWGGDTDKLSTQDFLRAFHHDTRASTFSTDKAKAFKNYLVAGSEVDTWYKALSAATKTDMDLLDAVIEARYPTQEAIQPTAAEYGVMLVCAKLKMEELGTKVKVADRNVWAQHVWANKMLLLATNAKVETTSTYIEQVRLDLPKQLRTKLGKTFTDWPAFVKAVRDVDAVDLEVEMREWREEEEARKRLTLMVERQPAPPVSPTAGIRAQLTNTTLGAPAQGARWTMPGPTANPFRGTGSGGQGNLFAVPRPTQFQPRPPAEQQQPLQGADRTKLLTAIAKIPHHPDTETGRKAHADQQQAWYKYHGNNFTAGHLACLSTPYPLRPGRAPINSGECFRCGYGGYTNFRRGCDAPFDQCISVREQHWCRIASQALREVTVAVHAVGFSTWDYNDYRWRFGEEEGRFEEVDNQGNA
ncbi:hypothetical protein C8R44DRAFT_604666 [Mycena epipterygia]|nr:hypothetical protein C8R44DRAFT_604666 [Mycena epipterygia]